MQRHATAGAMEICKVNKDISFFIDPHGCTSCLGDSVFPAWLVPIFDAESPLNVSGRPLFW